MALLTKELLHDLGIQMADNDYALLEEHFETTLRERVIAEIIEELSTEQAQELASMQSAGDQELLQWLQVNVLDFSDIVSDEVDILLGELAEHSEAFSNSPQPDQPDEHF